MAATRPVPLFAREQPLRNDVAETFCEAVADGLLFGQRKDSDDAFDGLRGVDGMQRGKHEVAGLGRLQRDFNRLLVAHFAHQNDLGRLPQGRAQRQRKAGRVAVQLALVNDGLLVAVHEFDGIFDREDVVRLGLVDAVENGGQRRGLARAGRAGDQHDAVLEVGNVSQVPAAVSVRQSWECSWESRASRSRGCRAARRRSRENAPCPAGCRKCHTIPAVCSIVEAPACCLQSIPARSVACLPGSEPTRPAFSPVPTGRLPQREDGFPERK